MIFIFGGAWQGMEEYAREAYGVQKIVPVSEDGEIDFSGDAVNKLERFVLRCVRNGQSSVECFEQMYDQWKDLVLIGSDISCGLVPMEAETRALREENGRLNSYLAQKSEHTIRLFCGLPQVLK